MRRVAVEAAGLHPGRFDAVADAADQVAQVNVLVRQDARDAFTAQTTADEQVALRAIADAAVNVLPREAPEGVVVAVLDAVLAVAAGPFIHPAHVELLQGAWNKR